METPSEQLVTVNHEAEAHCSNYDFGRMYDIVEIASGNAS